MSTDFPPLLDPWRAAYAEQEISASVAVQQLRRVHDKLVMTALEADARVQFTAAFSRDDHNRPLIHLRIQGQLPLRCQRSLKVYQQRLAAESWVVVVRDEAEAERVSEAYEPVLLNDKALALRDLIEEEVLLALPLVPLDPAGEALSFSSADSAVRMPAATPIQASAFAGLANLLDRQHAIADDSADASEPDPRRKPN